MSVGTKTGVNICSSFKTAGDTFFNPGLIKIFKWPACTSSFKSSFKFI